MFQLPTFDMPIEDLVERVAAQPCYRNVYDDPYPEATHEILDRIQEGRLYVAAQTDDSTQRQRLRLASVDALQKMACWQVVPGQGRVVTLERADGTFYRSCYVDSRVASKLWPPLAS